MIANARLAWVGVALALLVPSLLATTRELGAISGRDGGEIALYKAVLADALPDPLSFSGHQQNLLDCMEMADGIYGQLQFDSARRKMASVCRRTAQDARRYYPHYGFAALVEARMAAIEEDFVAFNRMLVLSQQGASAEQWVSVERLKLYVKYADQLEPATLPARAADIDLLLNSPVGIKSIASLYLSNQSLRALIAERAELLPEKVQADFLVSLKSILSDRSRSR